MPRLFLATPTGRPVLSFCFDLLVFEHQLEDNHVYYSLSLAEVCAVRKGWPSLLAPEVNDDG